MKHFFLCFLAFFVTISCTEIGVPNDGATLSLNPKIAVSSVTLNKKTLSLEIGTTETLIAYVRPSNATNNTVEWSSADSTVASVNQFGTVTSVSTGTTTITVTVDGKTATCIIKVITTEIVYACIDLGLSVKWATCNIGATQCWEYGDFFTWGATEPLYASGYAQENPLAHWKTGKSAGYCWNNTPYQTANTTSYSDTKWTKYLGSTTSSYKDGAAIDADAEKTVLDLLDDAAHANWGGNWRMPTYEEWSELKNSCTWTWTTMNGINGYKVQSKKIGYTDNWIFLPVAGYRSDTYLDNVGSCGYYWSSSLLTDDPGNARLCYFGSSYHFTNYGGRSYGLSVRSVCSDEPNCGITGVSLNKTTATITIGSNEKIIATVEKAEGAVNEQVQWSSSNTAVATVDCTGKVIAIQVGTATITARTVFGAYSDSCVVTVVEPISFGHEYVDLGLSVKWATMNLGATKPEGYGDYYAWGEIVPKSEYSWSTYKYCNESSTALTKYCSYANYGDNGYIDSRTILEMSDDVVNADWGGSWRIPTIEEWEKLNDNCTWTWTSLNGINGYIVQSKKAGYTDKWIFLPAAGDRVNTLLGYVGSYGCYWSGSLDTGNPSNARYFSFHSSSHFTHRDYRYYGQSVRPVCQ